MKGLITDRTSQNVTRRNELSAKGWQGMTAAEQTEWLGNPLTATAVNLLPPGPYFSSSVALRYLNDAIIATTNAEGIYLYAISIIGNATDFVNKTLTLSAEHIGVTGGGKPQLAVYWHDDNGFEYAGASLTEAGSVTFNTGNNAGNRAYLALYVYVTTDVTVQAGAAVRYSGVMLENGDAKHEYVPYTEVLPTPTTLGAYNYSDLNRVERAVREIADSLGLGLITKTDWAMWDIPTSSDMERYLSNINAIRESLSGIENIPTPPTSMDGLTFSSANDIEKILLGGYEKSQSEYRVGELYFGEVQ